MSIGRNESYSLGARYTTSSKSKQRHPIWSFFKYDEQSKGSFCQVPECGGKISGKYTTNLKKHLKTVHSELYSQFQGEGLEIEPKDDVYEEQQTKRRKKAHEEDQLYELSESFSGGNGSSRTKKKTVSDQRPTDDLADTSEAASYQSGTDPEDNDDGDLNEADSIEDRQTASGVVGGESGKVYRYTRNQNSDRLPEKLKELYMGQMGSLSDVMLFSSDGSCVEAHKVILALCSPYFQQIFMKISHASQATGNTGSAAVLVLGNVKTSVVKCLVEFIYTGEATVKLEEMDEFLKTGELYQIEGICTAPPLQQQKSSCSKNIKKTARKKTSVQPTSSRIINVRVVQGRQRRTKDKEIHNDSSEEGDLELDEDDGTLRRSSRISRPVNTQCKTEPSENEIPSDNEFLPDNHDNMMNMDREVNDDDNSGDEVSPKRRKEGVSSNASGRQRQRGRPKKYDNPITGEVSSPPQGTDNSTFYDHSRYSEHESGPSTYQQLPIISTPSAAGPSS